MFLPSATVYLATCSCFSTSLQDHDHVIAFAFTRHARCVLVLFAEPKHHGTHRLCRSGSSVKVYGVIKEGVAGAHSPSGFWLVVGCMHRPPRVSEKVPNRSSSLCPHNRRLARVIACTDGDSHIFFEGVGHFFRGRRPKGRTEQWRRAAAEEDCTC